MKSRRLEVIIHRILSFTSEEEVFCSLDSLSHILQTQLYYMPYHYRPYLTISEETCIHKIEHDEKKLQYVSQFGDTNAVVTTVKAHGSKLLEHLLCQKDSRRAARLVHLFTVQPNKLALFK